MYHNEIGKGLTFELISWNFLSLLDSALSSCCMHFSNCNFKEVLTFGIKCARQDKSSLLLQVLNIQKSLSVFHTPSTLFWQCIDIRPDFTYLDARLISFLHSQSLVDSLGNEEVFVSVFLSIGHTSAVNDLSQGVLNPVVEIIVRFSHLDTGLDVVAKLVVKGALVTIVWEGSIDWCRHGSIPFLWSLL